MKIINKICKTILLWILKARNIILSPWKPKICMPQQKYMGHALYHCKYDNNSMPMYRYLVEELGYKFIECDIRINEKNVPVLSHDEIKTNHYYATLSELLAYAKEKQIWVMLDWIHMNTRSFNQIYTIVKLIRQHEMELNVIIADAPILKFSLLYPWFTYQITGDWNKENIRRANKIQRLGAAIILSQLLEGRDEQIHNRSEDDSLKSNVDNAHRKGILMKAAVVNNVSFANALISIGTDLIMTDEIINPKQTHKVLTVGVYDLLHVGHINLFRRARGLGDSLLVAVQSNDFVVKFKPTAKVVFNTEERMYLVRSIRYVDDVCEYQNVSDIVKEVDFDIFVVGPDQTHQGFQEAFKWCTEHGKEIVVLPRTEGVSTSWLKEQIKTM